MYKVYFENRFEERIFIGEASNEEEIHQTWQTDLKNRNPNYKVYYFRSWTNNEGEKVIDCGSHCEYYIAVPESSN